MWAYRVEKVYNAYRVYNVEDVTWSRTVHCVQVPRYYANEPYLRFPL